MDYRITTQRLLLRPLGSDDLETACEYALDNDNTKFMMHLPNKNKAETEKFLAEVEAEWKKEKPDFYEFAVVLNGVQIGAVSVYIENKTGELGWILNKRYWGKGYAAEAAKELRNFCFDKLNLEKVTAHCDTRNNPSRKVMEKIGLQLENADGERIYVRTNEKAAEYTYSQIPVRKKIEYRIAGESDAELLVQIYNSSFHDDFIIYGECPAYGRTPGEMIKSIKEFPKHIIIYDSIPAGVVSLKNNGDGKYYIGCLCVIPEYQRKGIGSAAIKYVKKYYTDWKEFSLITPVDKVRNIEFYVNKCGFIIDKIQKDGTVTVAHFVLKR